ncbi:CAP family protein [Pseudanabaena sp. 'Roaring Creek']|uniref:CAP family protein n=1 Tax=Pseudanabaena sp. 'Roaring Creek' TaxID=1681830 RepID=UPI0006D781E6|nr:CAP family protein [Pseudanabaena sp. 'Roaring Creek']
MFFNKQLFIGLALTSLTIGLGTNHDSVSAQTVNLNTLRSTALSKHNTYRSIHHSPAMSLNSSVNSTAQAWADNLAATGTFAHSSSAQRNGAGENLYVYYTTAPSIASDTLAKNAIDSWYNEVKLYNYATPGFSSATGHFTQVVWKGSTKLGCGASKGTKTLSGRMYNAFYVVCQYSPAGNVIGQFPANVLKP